MKLLITGATGLLGVNLATLATTQHDVVGVCRHSPRGAAFTSVNADLLETGIVDSILDNVQPDWVIHCAALAHLEACEQDATLARRLNADLPGEIAKACAQREIRLVHISTDAVFDGAKDGFYTEQDIPNPLSVYADTKRRGEQAVIEQDPRAIVARVNFYGWSRSGQRSLAEFFFHQLSTHQPVRGFTDILFCPMFVNDLSRVLLAMLEKGLGGLYHVVGPQSMSKYEFGIEIARVFGFSKSLLTPTSVLSSGLTATRSLNLCLSTDKLSTALGHPLPAFTAGLNEFCSQHQQGFANRLRSS